MKIEHSDKKNTKPLYAVRLIGRYVLIACCLNSSKFLTKNKKKTNQIKQIPNLNKHKHKVTLIWAVPKYLPIVDYLKAMRERVYYADESQTNVFVMRTRLRNMIHIHLAFIHRW